MPAFTRENSGFLFVFYRDCIRHLYRCREIDWACCDSYNIRQRVAVPDRKDLRLLACGGGATAARVRPWQVEREEDREVSLPPALCCRHRQSVSACRSSTQ